jgi:hypothetical protein
MLRAPLIVLLVTSLAACTSRSELALDAAPLVEPAPELRELDRFVGGWRGTSELVSGSEAALAELPGKEGEPASSFEGGAEARWVLGGMFVKTESWHDTGTGSKIRYVDFKTWDAGRGKYRSWWFSDAGESGESWFTLDPDGSTFHVTATATRPDGSTSTGGGSITFTDEDTMEWTWFEDVGGDRLEFRGSNTRR